MEAAPTPRNALAKWLKILLKLAVSVACIWYISTKIDFSKAWDAVKATNPGYLALAALAFFLSKLLAAYRLNLYFNNAGLSLSAARNTRLYWLGMFYNLFLPGSISGDAYKVILLKRRYNSSYKKTSAAVLLDRFSGLLGLGLLLAVYSVFVIQPVLYVVGIVAGAVGSVFIFYWVIARWLPDFKPSFMPTLVLGIVVQGCQVICAYLIMVALGIQDHMTEYIFIFLVSSVASVLPLTIGGGLGIREVVFLEGARMLGLMRDTSFVIGSLFYLITVATSAVGAIYIFRDPLGATKKDPLPGP